MSPEKQHETPKQIERNIDQTRSEMDRTIDALQERLSLKNMTGRAREAVISHAPQPPGGGPSFYQKRPMIVGSVALAAGLGAGFLLSPPETRTRKTKSGPGMMDKAKATYHEKKETVRHNVRDAASGIAETAKRTFETGKDESRDVTAAAREGVRETALEAKEAVQHTWQTGKREARDVADTAKANARETKHEAKEASEATKARARVEAERQRSQSR